MIRSLTHAACALIAAAGLAAAEEGALTFEQLPAPVRTTLLAQAKGAPLTDIEKKVKRGKVLFEAEAVVDGRALEFTVADDGTLLKTEIEDGDEKDDKAGKRGKDGKDDDKDDKDDTDDTDEKRGAAQDAPPPAPAGKHDF